MSHTPDSNFDYLSMPFTLVELRNAIFSRKSVVPGTDGISPLMLKHIPPKGLKILLKIVNGIWNSGVVPLYWREFRVIPI